MDELLNELFELNLICKDCNRYMYSDDLECCNQCPTLHRLSEVRTDLGRLEDDLYEDYCF